MCCEITERNMMHLRRGCDAVDNDVLSKDREVYEACENLNTSL